VNSSLLHLGVDCIDLYQIHAPNPAVPIQDTLGAMEDLVDAGKIRHIGVSNFSVNDLKRALAVTRKHRIVSNQIRFNLIDRTHLPS
ncbi:MAG: aldo/keto reductase, partial [Verrucomicrobia bacterium]|nr:aldo/keto reductase [Verrucomicrobiota bacterium]